MTDWLRYWWNAWKEGALTIVNAAVRWFES